jgi:hypothetical protein
VNAKEQAHIDWMKLYGDLVGGKEGAGEKDYWTRLVLLGKDPHSRLFRTDHPSRSKTIYNLMVWKPSDPFLRIEVETESMMEVERWA